MTAAAAAGFLEAFAQEIVAALNPERFSVYQGFRQLFTGFAINALNGRPGDVHLIGALLLREVFQIDQPDRFIFVHGHHDKRILFGLRVQWAEQVAAGQTANFAHLHRSWHMNPPMEKIVA